MAATPSRGVRRSSTQIRSASIPTAAKGSASSARTVEVWAAPSSEAHLRRRCQHRRCVAEKHGRIADLAQDQRFNGTLAQRRAHAGQTLGGQARLAVVPGTETLGRGVDGIDAAQPQMGLDVMLDGGRIDAAAGTCVDLDDAFGHPFRQR